MDSDKNIKIDLKHYNKQGYKPGRSKLMLFLWFIINALVFQSPLFHLPRIKILLLRLFGAKVGVGVIIKCSVNIKYPWKLNIGDYVWIGEKVWIDNLAQVTIGSNVCISQGAMLLCGSHNSERYSFDIIIDSIILEDGVWIGAKAVVCPGVIAKSHSMLNVASIAIKDLDPFFIYQGNPAIKIRERCIK
jgi:putative colanic acid biosynthesis acetyltransferase WcaF